jgi:hypothetical protein
MIDSSCAGKAGMQIGSAREAIIIALLIYKLENKMLGQIYRLLSQK